MLHCLEVDGVQVTDPADIMAATQDFYQSLYTDEPIDAALKEEFLQDLPCLSDEDRDICEGKLSYEECYAAIKAMKDCKSLVLVMVFLKNSTNSFFLCLDTVSSI